MSVTWLVLLSVGSALSVPIRQSPESLCVSQENFVRIAAEGSCIKYFQCYSGHAYLMQCPDFTWFNHDQQICDESPPPEGCEVQGPPGPPPVEPDVPQEPEEQLPEPETDTEDPETEPEEPLEPEEPEGEPQEPEDPENEPQEPEEEQEPETDTEDSEDVPNESEINDEQEPEIQEPEPEVETEDPEATFPGEEPLDSTDEPDNPVDELEPPIEEITPPEQENEGSGDPTIEDIEEGSGITIENNWERLILPKLAKSEKFKVSNEELFFSSSDSSGDFPIDNFDYELDRFFIPLVKDENVIYEIPSIEPTFVLPDADPNF